MFSFGIAQTDPCKFPDRVLRSLEPSVHNVNAIGLGLVDVLLHEAAKAGEVGGDAGDAHHSALSWGEEDDKLELMHVFCDWHMPLTRSVAPWLIVGREDSQVTASDKLLIVQAKQRIGWVQELRMEDNLRRQY